MAISSHRAGVPRLREVIAAYRAEHTTLEQDASNLLARLQQSDDAAKAFARLMRGAAAFERVLQKGPPYPSDVVISPPRCNLSLQQKAAELLNICIEAEGVNRAFLQEIASAETMLSWAQRLVDRTAELRDELGNFVADVAKRFGSPPHLAGLSIFEPPSDDAALEQAFNLITRWIKWGSGHAQADIARLGATRKKHVKDAAHRAAIWCLGAQVRTVVGRPHWQEVADLANVILKTEETSAERARRAVRTGADLYAEMIGSQARRYHHGKMAEGQFAGKAARSVAQKSD